MKSKDALNADLGTLKGRIVYHADI
jgi:hypothetical protein